MAQETVRIIVVEKELGITVRLQRMLSGDHYDVARESSIDHVLERIERDPCDVLIVTSVAFQLGKIDGLEMLEVIGASNPRIQVLFVAEPQDIDLAMAALKAGTYHYAKQPINDDELRLLVETALHQRPPDLDIVAEEDSGFATGTVHLLGRAPAMREVFQNIQQAAATDIPILIAGETGTGKDLVAQAVHESSARRENAYIPVHLGALPPELVASELFGHERGAFTGATERRIGQFELGNEGTIFLDEISTIDEKVQISLLRLIEQRKFTRLGGRKPLNTNARVIAATNENLRSLVEQGAFREDLYYRLDVFHIDVPPLRERHGDIPLLVSSFIRRYNHAFQKSVRGISSEAASLLEVYPWPGNVRELKNVIQRAVLICTAPNLMPEHLPRRFWADQATSVELTYTVGTPLQDFEREAIQRTLMVARSRTEAAELLGISRRALYNKLARYGIE